jgi:hypothetical protein
MLLNPDVSKVGAVPEGVAGRELPERSVHDVTEAPLESANCEASSHKPGDSCMGLNAAELKQGRNDGIAIMQGCR